MRRNHPQSSSADAASTAWRVSRPIPRPASEPTDTPRSDLGSDDHWHCTMGSDSDLSDPTDTFSPSSLNEAPPSPVLHDHPNPAIHFGFHHDHDYLPQPAILPPYIPDNTRADLPHTPSAVSHYNQRPFVDDTPRPDPLSLPHHQSEASSAPPLSTSSPSNWADRPRHHKSVEVLAAQGTPPTPPANPPPISDSALSVSHAGSSPNGSAFHLSPRSFSDASDGSRKTSSKAVSFIDDRPPLHNTDESHHPITMGQTAVSNSAHSSTRSTSSLHAAASRPFSLQTSLKEGKLRLESALLGTSKRLQKRATPAAHSIHLSNPSSGTSSTQGSPFIRPSNPHPSHSSQSSSTGLTAQRPLSIQSERLPHPRHSSALSQQSSSTQRPLSTPNQRTFDSQASSQSSSSDVFFTKTALRSNLEARQKSTTDLYQMTMKPITKELSFLECVVELLRGSVVLKRKNFMNASEAWIWLNSDLTAVKYRTAKKGAAPDVCTLVLNNVRKLKGYDRDVSLDVIGEKKSLDFVFPSRERAEIWMSGLCCLVPSHASVKVKNRRWQLRETYDPLLDTWNGKPLATRKRLEEYILLGSIGRGSFGKVKLAFLSTDRQFFAVKVLSKAMMRKRNRSAPLERRIDHKDNAFGQLSMTDVNEIAVMKHLDHKNVMRMKGAFDVNEEDKLFIVVEFLPNGPIMNSSKLTGAKPLKEERARSAFVDVLSGLEYLHHNNVAHRDIKPDNLLEAGDGTVKISDFGAAILYRDDDSSNGEEMPGNSSTVGTPAFTAPELCVSEMSPTCPRRCFAADIWSLGATLFYMVYGRAPFTARSVFQMYDAICTGELVFPEGQSVSKSLQALIQRMLVKDPGQRATVEEIVKSAWLSNNVDVAGKVEELQRVIDEHRRCRQ